MLVLDGWVVARAVAGLTFRSPSSIGKIIPVSVSDRERARARLRNAKHLTCPQTTPLFNLLMAAPCLVVLPILAVFLFFQRFFIEGITLGSGR